MDLFHHLAKFYRSQLWKRNCEWPWQQCWLHTAREIQVDLSGDGGGDDEAVAFGAFDASDICIYLLHCYTRYTLPFRKLWPQVDQVLCHALDARAGKLSSIHICVAERLALGGREARSWRAATAS